MLEQVAVAVAITMQLLKLLSSLDSEASTPEQRMTAREP